MWKTYVARFLVFCYTFNSSSNVDPATNRGVWNKLNNKSGAGSRDCLDEKSFVEITKENWDGNVFGS